MAPGAVRDPTRVRSKACIGVGTPPYRQANRLTLRKKPDRRPEPTECGSLDWVTAKLTIKLGSQARRPLVQRNRSSVSSRTCEPRAPQVVVLYCRTPRDWGRAWSSRVLIKGPVVPGVLNVHTRPYQRGTSRRRPRERTWASAVRGLPPSFCLVQRNASAPPQAGLCR